MDKKTRNIVIAVIALIVVGLAVWLIAGGGKKTEPAATEAPAVTEAATEAPDKEEVKPEAEEKAEDVKAAVEEKTEEVKETAEDAKAAVEEKAEDVKAAVEEKTEEVKETAEDAKATVEEKAEDVKDAAEEKAEEVKEETKAEVEEKAENKKEAVKEDVETLAADVKETAKDVKAAAEEKAEETKTAVEDAKAAVEEKTEDVKAAVEEKAEETKTAVEDAKAAVEEKAEDVKAAVEEKAEDVKEKTEDVKAAVEEKAEDVKAAVEEKAEDIKEKTDDVKAAVEEKTEEIKAAAESADAAAKDEMQSMAIASVMPKIELKPMTVKEKITLNKDNVSAVAGLMFQGDKGKIEKLGQLIDFVNDMEYTVLFDGVDAEAFVSARGEDLASALVLRSDDSYSIYSDMYPNYYVDIKKEDLQSLAGENFQMPANVDPNKLTQAVMTPVMKMMTGVKFGEPEAVEETMFDTAFTSKTPINMTLKEMALLGLNCVKEIMDNADVASLLDSLKDKGIKVSVSDIDEAIKAVEASKDEEVPDVDAGMYTNEKNDMVFKVDVSQDGKIVSHSVGGKVGNNGVSEVQIADQMYVKVTAGNDGAFITVKAQGMELAINVVPEKRANGRALVATISFMNLEMAKIEVEKLNEGILTGKFNIDGKKEITIKDLKEKGKELVKEVLNDATTNYLPALKEKIQKIAPEMMSLFSSAKKLIKNAPQMIPAQMLPTK